MNNKVEFLTAIGQLAFWGAFMATLILGVIAIEYYINCNIW